MSSDPLTSEPGHRPPASIHTILIADDRYENRYLLQMILEGNGYQVISVENGEQALQKVRSEPVDAIISDILMPVIDGFQFCRTVREDPALSHLPFIFYTASYTEEKDRKFGLSIGADEYISKPIEPQDLIDRIREVFTRVSLRNMSEPAPAPPDTLAYYTTYADLLGRKLDEKLVESEEYRAAARFSEEKYLSFLQNLQGIGYLCTSAGDPEIFEGQVIGITGYPASSFLSGSRRWPDIIHPEDRPAYLRERTHLISGAGHVLSCQYRIIHADGTIRWVHEQATSLPGQLSESLMVQGAISDITPQKEAEEQIRISEEYYRNLFETMAEGVIYLDGSGNIINANPSAERILGLSVREMLNMSLSDHGWFGINERGTPVPEDERPSMVALRTGKPSTGTVGFYNRQDSRYHWLLIHAIPLIHQGQDSPNQIFTTFEDITQEKEARDHAEHLNQILRSIRMVNVLITGEMPRDVLLRSICSSLIRLGGYEGVWVRHQSDSEEWYSAVNETDPTLLTIDAEIRAGNLTGDDAGPVIITRHFPLKQDSPLHLDHTGFGVLITRLVYEAEAFGTIYACVCGQYLQDPQEHELFSEIARDVGFALHHSAVLRREESAQKALKKREHQYRSLVENISDTLFTLNPAGEFIYISPSITTMTGQLPEYYLNQDFRDFIDDEDREAMDTWFSQVASNHAHSVEFKVRHEGSRVQYLRAKGTPAQQNGETILVNGILTDVTAQREAERTKTEHDREVQTLLTLHHRAYESESEILSFALNAVLELTASEVGFITFINEEETEAHFQVWAPQVMDSCHMEVIAPHQITSLSGLWAECIRTKKPMIINDMSLREDGHGYPEGHIPIRRFLEVPIIDGDRITAIMAVANRRLPYTDNQANALNTLGNTLWEIIHRKRADEQIKHALTQITRNMEQLATLNDTIRNPLTVIAILSEFLDEAYRGKVTEAVRNIDEMINRLDRGWVQSDKVKNFLIRHHQFKEEDFKES